MNEIVFLQKKHIDTSNSYIDQIIKENDDEKKIRASKLNSNNTIDMISTGYVAQLFSIFNNNE